MREHARVLVVQTEIREAGNGPRMQAAITDNLYRSVALIEKAIARSGRPDIVVLPEFFLTGYASTRTHAQSLDVARRVPGPETDVLGALAAQHGMYVAGAAWQFDPTWPDRYFNTAFIVGPSGEVELTYRKMYEGNYQAGLTATTPGDVYDHYVERHGEDAMFPVLETEFGTLACVICYDLNFPETVRRLALRGAEIILNPTGEVNGAYLDVWESTRRSRAFENQCFWVSANHGGYTAALTHPTNASDEVPAWFTGHVAGGITASSPSHGRSEIVDFRGKVIAGLSVTGEATLDGYLDLGALRAARAAAPAHGLPVAASITPSMAGLFASGYAAAPGFPLNRLLCDPLREIDEGARHLAAVLSSLRGSAIVPDLSAGEPPRPANVLAYQADVRFLGPCAADAPGTDVSAAITDNDMVIAVCETVGPLAVSLGAEVRRTGARIVVMPDGWPVAFAAPDEGEPTAHLGLDLDGLAFKVVRDLAETLAVYLVGSTLERGPDGPCRTGWIVDPTGALALTRRALAPLPGGFEPATTPDAGHNVADGFSVLDTPYGRLGVAIGRELMSVEVVRMLTFAGAEIIANPAGEYDASLVAITDEIRRTRAAENVAYVISASPGPLRGPVPEHAARGRSSIVDFTGDVLVESAAGLAGGIAAPLYVARLRGRRNTGAGNCLVQLRPQLYPAGYRTIKER
jgi:predicted amidohydrolase